MQTLKKWKFRKNVREVIKKSHKVVKRFGLPTAEKILKKSHYQNKNTAAGNKMANFPIYIVAILALLFQMCAVYSTLCVSLCVLGVGEGGMKTSVFKIKEKERKEMDRVLRKISGLGHFIPFVRASLEVYGRRLRRAPVRTERAPFSITLYVAEWDRRQVLHF